LYIVLYINFRVATREITDDVSRPLSMLYCACSTLVIIPACSE